MPEYTHDRFGKCVLAEITQKQLVDYSKLMQDKKDMTMIEWRGESVKAAIKCGFFVEPTLTDKEVDDSSPALIRWMSDECIAKMISEASNIDPLS